MLLKLTKLRSLSNVHLTAISYRMPMQVKEILQIKQDNGYPVCPRCNCTIDREYMHFCDRCGQCLGWDAFENATVIHKWNRLD